MNASEQRVGWEESFSALRGFVDSHDRIRMTRQSLSVPVEVRGEFYELVDQVQMQLTRAVLASEADEAVRLAAMCGDVKERLMQMSGLAEFGLGATLERFADNPMRALAKPAFGIALDALQRGSGAEDIALRAREELLPFNATLQRCAYEAWAYCGIVAALNPKRFYAVHSPDTVELHAVSTDSITIGSQVSSPERRIPEAVFETDDGRFFAMKTEAAHELDFYGVRIERRRDTSAGGNTAGLLSHRALLLYRLGSLADVQVVADRGQMKLVPPDLFCEVLLPAEMEYPAYVSAFVERINAVRSRRPMQVLRKTGEGSFPDGMLEDRNVAPLEVRTVGYEEAELKRIADLLA